MVHDQLARKVRERGDSQPRQEKKRVTYGVRTQPAGARGQCSKKEPRVCVIPGNITGRALPRKDRGAGFESRLWILLFQRFSTITRQSQYICDMINSKQVLLSGFLGGGPSSDKD